MTKVTREQFIDILPIVARMSDDPDTQTAAILVSTLGESQWIVSGNILPVGVDSLPERLTRPEKYKWIMHAERAVLAMAARSSFRARESTMYINWFPCADCAQMIVQSGVAAVDCNNAAYEARRDDPKYGFEVAKQMLLEAGVIIRWH